MDILCLLNNWVELTQIFGGEMNRKIAKVGDDDFWGRLASTTFMVGVVCTQSMHQQSPKELE